jgi:hypothetical protein
MVREFLTVSLMAEGPSPFILIEPEADPAAAECHRGHRREKVTRGGNDAMD